MHRTRAARLLILLAAASIFAAAPVSAQISDRLSNVSASEYHPGEPLTLQADLLQASGIDRITVAYRTFGARDFQQTEMAITGNHATATIPAGSLTPPFLEYYFILAIRGNEKRETYPVENAELNPLKVDLQVAAPRANAIVILSPERDERVPPDDLLISFSLVHTDSTVNRSNIKVFVDNADLSQQAVISGDIVVLRLQNGTQELTPGPHVIRIELYTIDGKMISSDGWSFTATGFVAPKAATAGSAWSYASNVLLEARNETISSTSTPYNRATLSASGQYGDFKILGKLYATNEEKSDRQPQNRYFIGAESPWLSAGYGDQYPVFPQLFMNGKRVRGFAGDLTLGAFNLDITQGDIVRNVEGSVVKIFSHDSLQAERALDSTATYAPVLTPVDGSQWAKYNSYGTFNRTLFAVRPSFGPREGSHIGFTYLKSKDDVGSILYGIRPQENIVLGSDLMIALDKHNIEISGQGAFSATNSDITKGSLEDSSINAMYPDPDYSESTRNDIKQARNILSKLITFNENLIPLSLKDLSTLAYEGGISLNYFNNLLRATYQRHGASYQSFGQTYLRPDVKGFAVNDRLGLLSNQLYLSGGYEKLKDNTAELKPATTTSTTLNVGISYFPRTNFPNLTIAYLRAANLNDYASADSAQQAAYFTDDQTNRVLFQVGKEFTFSGQRHSAALSISTSTRDDRTVRNLDTRNTGVTASDMVSFGIPLQASLSIAVNSSEFVQPGILPGQAGKISLTYTTLMANVNYRMLQDRIRFTGSLSPTFGDLQRTLINGGAQYYFLKNISAEALLYLYMNNKLFFNTTTGTDVIWSFVVRADV